MMKNTHSAIVITLAALACGGLLMLLSKRPAAAVDDKTHQTGEPTEAQIANECVMLAERYGFSPANKQLCGKYVRSELSARTRLAELKQVSRPTASYCEAQADFRDAYDLERWAINDAKFRMSRIGANDEELRKIRIAKTLVFLGHIASRIRARDYESANCGIPLFGNNYVFNRHPSVAVTEFDRIGTDYEEAVSALHWRRMANHELPHYDVIGSAEIAAARKAVADAYDKKYGKK